jgi:hypothetical protein
MEELELYGKRALTPREVVAQVQRIHEVFETVMKKDVHYGMIPGVKKPSLWKPGAQKICATFHLVKEEYPEELSTSDVARYRVRCELKRPDNGELLGSSTAECSSDEEKYKWREVVHPKEWEATPESHRRIKYGRTWRNNKPDYWEKQQIRTSPADMANTILRMAAKRAFVSVVLDVTAASDVFDMNLEDLPDGLLTHDQDDPPPPPEPPEKKTVEPPAKINAGQIKAIKDLFERVGIKPLGQLPQIKERLQLAEPVALEALTFEQASRLIKSLSAEAGEKK